MADDVDITEGTGTTVATDDIGGRHFQRVKVTWGPDGTASDADVATGKPLPVQVRSATGLVPIGEPTDDKSTATDTTSVSLVSLVKQLSASLQALVTALADPATETTLGGVALESGGNLATIASALGGTLTVDATGQGDLPVSLDGEAVVLGAGTAHVGQVKTPIQYVTVDMTTPTDAQDAGDVVAATQVVAGCTQANDVLAVLHTLTLIDPDDQKAKLRIVFFDANTTLGTEDAAPDIDDTEVQTIIGMVDIAVADYVDLGGASVVNLRNLGLIVKPASGTDDIYMAIYTPDTSTPTYAGGHLYVRLGFI